MNTKDVFIYHLDNELQKLFSLSKYDYNYLYTSFKSVVRLAFLICKNRILIPASNYFESDLSFKILNELKELNEIGAIGLISSSHNIEELLRKKVEQHGENVSLPQYHYADFMDEGSKIVLPGALRKRERSASEDIKKGWDILVNKEDNIKMFAKLSFDTIKTSKIEELLHDIPSQLGGRAYISDYILPLLPIKNERVRDADNFLNVLITREYISSFLKEYNASCLKDIPIIDSSVILPNDKESNDTYISYSEVALRLKTVKYREKDALTFINDCSAYELIEFKSSLTWQTILESLTKPKRESASMRRNDEMSNYNDIKIGIITALPKECAAMKMMLQDVEECYFNNRGAGHRFYIGKLGSSNGKEHRVALTLCGMGNNKAAIRATNMLNHFSSIDSIIMTGIAGGIPSLQDEGDDVRLGDVIVSKGVTQYDFIKKTTTEINCRSSHALPSAQLLEAVDVMSVNEYADCYPWHQYIDEFSVRPQFVKPSNETDKLHDMEGNLCEHPYDSTRTGYPKVFLGQIASANTLLKDPIYRNMLKQKYGALAVEMEASGIADATWNYEVGYLVVRGICDYCDEYKNDVWQEYAALVAAAYTRSLIEHLPCF